MSPINNLTIQSIWERGPRSIQGWYFNPVDLNTGVGGAYIYAGWQRGNNHPITSLGFGTYSTSQQDNPWPGWNWNMNDLNRGAGGRFIYMFWRSNPGYRPIYNITFLVTGLSSPPSIPGYQAISVDLNMGSDGPYIWPYVTYSSNLGSDAAIKGFDLREGEVVKVFSNAGLKEEEKIYKAHVEELAEK